MKLYYHPTSTTSRAVLLFAMENEIPLDLQVIDLFTGEHYQPAFEAINPNRLVPVLEDGDFRLTECSAILKYLADKTNSPLYPKDLRQRARVNERMDWVNTQLGRDFCYGFVYPQIFPNHKRRSDEAQAATLQWGKERAQTWLKVLDAHILGTGNDYVCGKDMSIADFHCAASIGVGEVTGNDFSAYPNVRRWLERMKALKSWKKVHEAIEGYGATFKGTPMHTL